MTARNNKGFTLIELLIVMIILGLLASLVAPKMFGKIGKSKQQAAKAQISMLESAIETYRLDVGSFPTEEQGLAALREPPSGVESWDGPYLPKEVPLDPWGNRYEYHYPSEHSYFEIVSYGAEGRSGREEEKADIFNLKKTHS